MYIGFKQCIVLSYCNLLRLITIVLLISSIYACLGCCLLLYVLGVQRHLKKYVKNEHTAVDCTQMDVLLSNIHMVS